MPQAPKPAVASPPAQAGHAGRWAALRRPGALAVFLLATGVGLAGDLWSKHAAFDWLLTPSVLADPQNQQHARRMSEHLQSLPEYVTLAPAVREAKVRTGVLRGLDLRRQVMPGVQFTLSTNPGVVFGLPMPKWSVVLATFLTTGLVLYFFATADPAGRSVHAALGMILAGAMGNLYDRLLVSVPLPGLEPIRRQVRDFIDCSQLHYPYIFNVADILLVVGVGLLMLHWFLAARKQHA